MDLSHPCQGNSSLPQLPVVNRDRAGLVLAAIGAAWLMIGFIGCFEQPPPQPVTEQR